ncbi:WAP four-disulfide core domain protein 1 isoform X4 [Vombatus ursinus]|uniref:WAP four-disulfide core domain protein 1 isoform X4 n=1 Tax=Vombatus ursinus TaxID=29139 RepID=UPI000FFD53EB|nr:WAP four-disulfide core domain protein 1 isoform X4 [Vombatus ursinus]
MVPRGYRQGGQRRGWGIFFPQTLCIFLLLLDTGSARGLWKRAVHLKLAEKSQDYEYPLHSHGGHHPRNERCPPPPQTLPKGACEVTSCRSDSVCERHKRCCFNGCTYACLESVQPPPAEACSTTEDGAEPLHCPTGYECHIINPGNSAEGIPNRGQCIKQRKASDGQSLKHKSYKDVVGSNSNYVVGYEKERQKRLH